MEKLYSDLLKRQEAEQEKLLGQRYNDIETLQQMGRAYDEIKRVHDKYQTDINALAAKHEREKAAYLKQQETAGEQTKQQKQDDKAAELLRQYRERQESRNRNKGLDLGV